ncbi:UPF0481 protein At3g47200-like [Salvia hispanica]|uniref:UPF0481 protein At3g47200-like n=1 Tax=Salvia hispanica TaxID=49212 RepID=UPI0020095A3B|nr:UPF0481 protein At3g47200-like [Salvia hispanica]
MTSAKEDSQTQLVETLVSSLQKMTYAKEESQSQLVETLESSLRKKFEKLSADPSYSYAASIYKVSRTLRKKNEGAYTPRLVSIGPLHHDLSQLQDMEPFKLRFTHKFLTRCGIDLKTIAEFAAKEESFVRGCYEGRVELPRNRLAEVIVLDGIFIVELFLENYFIQLRDKYERIFDIRSCMYNDLIHDMLLVENQLPMKIMESLLHFVDLSFFNEGTMVTIYDLAHKFFKNIGYTSEVPLTAFCCQARHFVEFLLFLHAPPEIHALPYAPASEKFDYTCSVGELVKAGVRLHAREGNCLFDVSFNNGVLTIPKLTVNGSTETFFLNLIAFEQQGYYGYSSKNITSYVMLMDRFIDTSGDVDLLVKHGIIKNELARSQQVADLFNNLHTEVNDFYFTELCGELTTYSKSRWHQWRASWYRWSVTPMQEFGGRWDKWKQILGSEYFGNPWSVLSVIGVILILVLTITQTVFTILQVTSAD